MALERLRLGQTVPAYSPTQAGRRESSPADRIQSLWTGLFAPVDISFLVLFRITLSAAMLWTVWEFFSHDSIAKDYIRPPFHFTYHGFSWVKPWAGIGMYVHCVALGVLAILFGIGLLYRLSATLVFLGFTYVFLLEKALYLNHYYLMCLLCFIMIFLPANRRLAVDSLLWPALRTDAVPAWTLWLLRFQIALPYFLGGIAKLKPDWLSGQPMHSWLPVCPLRYLAGPVVEEPWVALVFSWGGALFDLCIVPLLLWSRSRNVAYCVAVAFHLANAFLFNIGVFPWLMIGATLVFFPPAWPRRLLGMKLPATKVARVAPTPPTTKQKLIGTVLLLYMSISLLVPFRHLLYPGNVLWTEEGHLFAWNMMLRTKVTGVQVLAVDPLRKTLEPVDVLQWLTPRQIEEMTHDPEMMREFAAFVEGEYRIMGRCDVEVHVVALSSLNGRKPQMLVDPTVDLARQPRTLGHKQWIVPLVEPFRRVPWDIPVSQWHDYVSLTPPTQDASSDERHGD